jgi:hypothetical protein
MSAQDNCRRAVAGNSASLAGPVDVVEAAGGENQVRLPFLSACDPQKACPVDRTVTYIDSADWVASG